MSRFTEFAAVAMPDDLSDACRRGFTAVRYGAGWLGWDAFDVLVGVPGGFSPVTIRILKPDGGLTSDEALAALAEAGFRSCTLREIMTLGALRPDPLKSRDVAEIAALKLPLARIEADIYLGDGGYGRSVVIADHDPGNLWSGGAVFPAVAL